MLIYERMINNEFISVKELADNLGVSRITVFNRIKKGVIRAQKVGRNYIIRRSDVPSMDGRIDEATKKLIDQGIRKTVKEYGEVLKLLGRE